MKKEKIIAAALNMVIENGVHAAPMSAIAKAANTGMGTIYNYFANKEELINAIYMDIKQKEEVLLSQPNPLSTTRAQFEHYYILVTDFYLRNPAYFHFMHQLKGSPIITQESREEGYKAIAPVISILENGQKEGVIKAIRIEELLQFVGGAVFSYLGWAHKGATQELDPASFKNQIQLVWDAIKA